MGLGPSCSTNLGVFSCFSEGSPSANPPLIPGSCADSLTHKFTFRISLTDGYPLRSRHVLGRRKETPDGLKSFLPSRLPRPPRLGEGLLVSREECEELGFPL